MGKQLSTLNLSLLSGTSPSNPWGAWIHSTELLGDRGDNTGICALLSLDRHWCEQIETVHVEEEVSPRQEDLVPCTSLYHYGRLGWQLDLSWGGRVGLPRPSAGLCAIYK